MPRQNFQNRNIFSPHTNVADWVIWTHAFAEQTIRRRRTGIWTHVCAITQLKPFSTTAQIIQIPQEFEWVRFLRITKNKKGALCAPFLFLVTRTGIEPMISAWEANVLTAWPTGHAQDRWYYTICFSILQVFFQNFSKKFFPKLFCTRIPLPAHLKNNQIHSLPIF